ncbi:MAG: hypothetical protein ACO3A2_11640 [Bdellovibrionia bacterium]
MEELKEQAGVSLAQVQACAQAAWEKVLNYDSAIAREMGERSKLELRYGENPHQTGVLEFDRNSPIDWGGKLSAAEMTKRNKTVSMSPKVSADSDFSSERRCLILLTRSESAAISDSIRRAPEIRSVARYRTRRVCFWSMVRFKITDSSRCDPMRCFAIM